MTRLYDHRWRAIRKRWLQAHPLCAYCEAQSKLTPATVVDHIEPHRGDLAKFYNEANYRSLCAACHNSVKQSEEKRGKAVPVTGLDGWPVG